MKKYSKLALLLAMMIGVSSTMAACNNPSPDDDNSGRNYLLEEELKNNAINKTKVDEWLKYVEYNKEEIVNKKVSSSVLTQKDTDFVRTSVSSIDTICEMVETAQNYIQVKVDPVAPALEPSEEPGNGTPVDPEGPVTYEQKLSEYVRKTTLSLKETGKEIVTLTQKTYAVENDKLVDATKTKADQIEYDVDYLGLLVKVEKTTYKLKDAIPSTEPGEPAVEFDRTLVSSYYAVKTYSYYNAKTGDIFLENLSEEENQTVVIRGNIVDALDKTYLFVDGEVVREFALNMEYELPIFNKDNQQTMVGNYDEYVFFEQGEYGYRIDEETPIIGETVGDLTSILYPGLSVRVYKDYEMVAIYETQSYHIAGYAVLPNGNVYICEYKLLDDNATTYDFELNNFKIKVVHTVLDVATGNITEKDNKFAVQKLYSNVTDQIQTTLNRNTVLLDQNTVIEGMKVKDGYVLAEVQNYKNGALEGNTDFVVLNAETLEQVAVLPKIVPGQFGYLGFISKNEMLLNTRTVDNKIIRYTANIVDGDLELFTKGSVILLENEAFVYDGKIYDYDWEVLQTTDNTKYGSFESFIMNLGQPKYLSNGKFIFSEVEYDFSAMSNVTKFYLGEIVEDEVVYEYKDGSPIARVEKRVSINELLTVYGTNYSLDYNGSCYELKLGSSIVNFLNVTSNFNYGYSHISVEYVLDLDDTQRTIYNNSDGTYANYLLTKKVTSSSMLTDGTMLVCVTETWNMSYSNAGSPSADVLKYEGRSYNQYYIIK